MKLDELIEYLDYKDLINFKNIDITGISYNSKTTKKGDIFVCLVGEHTDGHEFAQDAINSGATALLVERKVEGTKIPQVVVSSTLAQTVKQLLLTLFKKSSKKTIKNVH